jgi:sugar phosphate isomerase/epimerase
MSKGGGRLRAGVVDSTLRRGDESDGAVFERAHRVGFAGVEVVLQRDDLRSRRLESLRRAMETTGVEIPSLVLGVHNEDGGIADADPAVAARAADQTRTAIAWAAELGADVVLVPFFLRGELVERADVGRCAAGFAALCPTAAAVGVTLCYEGTLPAEAVLELAHLVDSPAFGCYFDLANPVVSGLDPATEARRLGRLVRRVHFKDARTRRGDCQPGLGRVDYAECARALTQIGYEGWLVLETPPAPPEVVARDLSFARRCFPALEPTTRWPRFGAFTHELGVSRSDLSPACRELGVETVQLSRGLLDEWLEAPNALEVPVAGIGAYKNLIAPDAAERQRNLAFVERCLELAPLSGTSIVSTHAGTRHATEEWSDSSENLSPEAWALFLDGVERLLSVAERSGTLLALEGSVKSVLRTLGQVIELLDRFPSPHLRLVCDPYNFVSRHLLPAHERATTEFLGRFEHRFVLAHVKDVGPDGAEVSTPTVGTGVFAQMPYVAFLRENRPDLPLILEHLAPEQIPAAMRAVTSA